MIIIRLTGGLGNQLFQYAFGRSLAYNLDKELFLDVSSFSHNEKRKHVVFGLNAFNIRGIIGYYPFTDETNIGINMTDNVNIKKFQIENPFKFPSDILSYGETININPDYPTYFMGYFQKQKKTQGITYITENFFKENYKLIRNDLKYKLPLDKKYDNLIEEINNFDSICLHVRRGDYLSYPNFGFCTKHYYENAMDLMASKLDNPKFFIFSEDQEWVEKNINFKYPYKQVHFNESKNSVGRGYAELLYVMSLCNHFIIANSTFSWWASWLSENNEKIIISPKPWFVDRSFVEVDTIDNKNTIQIVNNYHEYFNESEKVLWKLDKKNLFVKNLIIVEKNGVFELSSLSPDSKIMLKNIPNAEVDKEVIIHFHIKTQDFNGLKLFYKTDNSDFNNVNMRVVYFYDDEIIDYYAILPSNCDLNELLIKPNILNTTENILELFDIEIRQMN